MKVFAPIFIIFILSIVSGCGFYVAKNNPEVESFPIVEGPLEPNFVSIRDHVFQAKCLRCHKDGGSLSEIPLDIYDNMMAVEGLVVPGNPDASSLVGSILNGSMPPRGVQVSAEELQVIRQWITDGAIKAKGEK